MFYNKQFFLTKKNVYKNVKNVLHLWQTYIYHLVAALRSGYVVGSINKVTLRRARF